MREGNKDTTVEFNKDTAVETQLFHMQKMNVPKLPQ